MAASILFRRSASLLLSTKSVRRSSLRSLSSGNPKSRAFASALPHADAVCAAPAPAVDGYVADLIQFGAVHYALVYPPPPPTATSEQLRIFKEVTAPSVLRKRASIKGKTVGKAQKTFRITDPGQFVEAVMCYEIDWKSRIIAVADSYAVLDKAAGTSVGGTTDNLKESCATFATRALGLVELLKTPHQIDNCSEGCVVLAGTKEYCSVFHGMIREKQVKKLYLALAGALVLIVILTTTCSLSTWLLDLFLRNPSKDGTSVKWRYWSASKFHGLASPLRKSILLKMGDDPEVNTHMSIRTQLTAWGSPIIGDSAYMLAALAKMENPGTNLFGRSRRSYSNAIDKELATAEWIAVHGKEPTVAIGLQAYQVSWDEGKHIYEARTPWWRS